jgi:hypothetical protein
MSILRYIYQVYSAVSFRVKISILAFALYVCDWVFDLVFGLYYDRILDRVYDRVYERVSERLIEKLTKPKIKILHKNDIQCPICLDNDVVCDSILNCKHAFCHQCIIIHSKKSNSTCPLCRVTIKNITISNKKTFETIKNNNKYEYIYE